ncbi:MAG: hypothetical protein ACK4XK_12690 [Casimicrobiaceae bacterium]
MLADEIVLIARSAMQAGKYVAISTDRVEQAQIREIEHVGSGLIRFRYNLPNDLYMHESRIIQLEVRPAEWDQ